MNDTYRTLASPSEGLYKDKGSRFLAYAFPISTEEEVKEIVVRLKKLHHSARHHCFAWRLGSKGELSRINDDGEPSGTAGRPILNIILSTQLTNVLVVVVRYFGGILLGTPGLINAYKQATADAFERCTVIEKIVELTIRVKFDYLAMNSFMSILKEYRLEMVQSNFDLTCTAAILVRSSLYGEVIEKLSEIDHLELLDEQNPTKSLEN